MEPFKVSIKKQRSKQKQKNVQDGTNSTAKYKKFTLHILFDFLFSAR